MPMKQEFICNIHRKTSLCFFTLKSQEIVFGSWRAWNQPLAPIALRRYLSIVLPFRTIYLYFPYITYIISLQPLDRTLQLLLYFIKFITLNHFHQSYSDYKYGNRKHRKSL